MEKNLSDLVYQGMAILFFTTAITLFFNLYHGAFRLQDVLQNKISTERGDVVTKALNQVSEEPNDEVSGAYLITEAQQGTTITIIHRTSDNSIIETVIQGKEQKAKDDSVDEHFEEFTSTVETSKIMVNGIYRREVDLLINDNGSGSATIKYRLIRSW